MVQSSRVHSRSMNKFVCNLLRMFATVSVLAKHDAGTLNDYMTELQ